MLRELSTASTIPGPTLTMASQTKEGLCTHVSNFVSKIIDVLAGCGTVKCMDAGKNGEWLTEDTTHHTPFLEHVKVEEEEVY